MWPGNVENTLQVMNMNNQGVAQLPIKKIKAVIGAITSQNKCVARNIFVLNAPMAISVLYKAVSVILDQNLKQKVHILNSNTCSALLELAAPNQIEEKFGGTAPNKQEGQFWPPSLPDENFGIDEKSVVTNVENKYVDINVEEEGAEEDEFQDCV